MSQMPHASTHTCNPGFSQKEVPALIMRTNGLLYNCGAETIHSLGHLPLPFTAMVTRTLLWSSTRLCSLMDCCQQKVKALPAGGLYPANRLI